MSVSVFCRHDFGGFRLDAAFEIGAAGVTALFGPSGAGKTTVINAIAGLFAPREGRILMGPRTVLDTAANVFVPPRARRIGYVFQDAKLFPHLSVKDNLLFGWRRAPQKADDSEIARVIDMLGLAHLLQRLPVKLSGGEKSRVALGRALLSSPELLLLDEPLAALDVARKAEILPYLERLRDESRIPMLYVSHMLDEVMRFADRMIVLKEGRVAAQGRVFDLAGSFVLADLTGISALSSVIETRIAEQRATDGLTILAFDGGEIAVPVLNRPVGARVRVRIRAEDVMLAREEPKAISANNVLKSIIAEIRNDDAGHADVRVACGDAHIIARITRASARRLELVPGAGVFAVIKSVIADPAAA